MCSICSLGATMRRPILKRGHIPAISERLQCAKSVNVNIARTDTVTVRMVGQCSALINAATQKTFQ